MAYGKWNLTQEEEKYFLSLFRYMIDELTCGRQDEFNLSGKGITPAQVIDIMDALGYKEKSRDYGGWEQDTWYYFENTNIGLFSCGQTFDLALCKGD